MTFSIVACDLEEQSWGVAVASKFPAVGAVVPWAQAEVGAVATQSFANTSFGPRGLALMGTGFSAQETLDRLLEDDPDKELRQVGLVDAKGGSATFSGTRMFCLGRWCFRQRICHSGKYSRPVESRPCDGEDFPENKGKLADSSPCGIIGW